MRWLFRFAGWSESLPTMPVFDVQPESDSQSSAVDETPEEAARQVAFLEVAAHEREVLAQRLHDTVCQSLSGLQLLVHMVEERAGQECPPLLDDVIEIREVVTKTSDEVRQLVTSLRSLRATETFAPPESLSL